MRGVTMPTRFVWGICFRCVAALAVLATSLQAATVAHYRFEGTGSTVTDTVSGQSHGNLNGEAVRAALIDDEANVPVPEVFIDGDGTLNQKSLSVTGAGSAFMTGVPFQFHQGGTENATIEFFLKVPDMPPDGASLFWTKSGVTDNNRYNIHISVDRFLSADYREPSIEEPSPLHGVLGERIPIAANNWMHIAITRRLVGNGAHEYRTYVNYVLQSCATMLDLNPFPPVSTEWQISGREGFDAEFSIDELRFSDTALASGDFIQVSGPPAVDCDTRDCNRYNFQLAGGILNADYREPGDAMFDPPHSVGGGVAVIPDEWVHYAVVRTDLGAEHQYQWYVDGVLDEGLTAIDAVPVLPDRVEWSIGGRAGFPIFGLIDEVRMTASALAPSDFLAVGSVTSPQLLPNVTGYLRFEEGSGRDIHTTSNPSPGPGTQTMVGTTFGSFSTEVPGAQISGVTNNGSLDLTSGGAYITENLPFVFHEGASSGDATVEWFMAVEPQGEEDNGSVFWTRLEEEFNPGPVATVAHYRFDEASGDLVTDSVSGNAHGFVATRDGSAITNDVWSDDIPAGEIGGVINNGSLRVDENTQVIFNMPDDDHMSINGVPFVMHSGAFSGFDLSATFECYIKPVRNQPHGALLWTNGDGSDTNRFNVSINPGGGIASDYRDPNGTATGTQGTGIPIDVWSHLALVRTDNGVAGHHYQWFVDGLPQLSATVATPSLPNSEAWTIGGRPGGPSEAGFPDDMGWGVDVIIDEVRFSRGARLPESFLINEGGGGAVGAGGAGGIVAGGDDTNRINLRQNGLSIGADYRSAEPLHDPPTNLGFGQVLTGGVWQHVAVVRTDLGSGVGHLLQWYFDGVENPGMSVTYDPDVNPLPIDDGWGINTRDCCQANGTRLDEIRITNLALVPEEFLMASEDASLVDDNDIQAYYRFEDENSPGLDSIDGSIDGVGATMASTDVPGAFISGRPNSQSLHLSPQSSMQFVTTFGLHKPDGDVTLEFYINPVPQGEAALFWTRAGTELPVTQNVPLAYLRFEEGSGTDIIDDLNDETVGFHNAQYSNDVPLNVIPATGAINQFSLQIDADPNDGMAGAFATITDRAFALHDATALGFGANEGDDATVEWWMKVAGDGFEQPGSLFWTRADDADENRINVTLFPNVGMGLDYRPSVDVGRVQTLNGPCSITFSPDTWIHFAIVRRTQGSLQTYTYYMEGVELAFRGTTDGNPDLPTSTEWSIGGRPPAGGGGGAGFVPVSEPVTVLIDEIRMHRGALSPNNFLVSGDVVETGACCTAGSCAISTQSVCEAGGGDYQGDGTDCGGVECPGGGTDFRRGDHDGSGLADITDALNLLGFLFLGTTPPICGNASDFDNSGLLDITDALILLGHLFLGQPNALPAPGTSCGPNPTTPQPGIPPIPPQEVSDLGCDQYPGPAFPGAACP